MLRIFRLTKAVSVILAAVVILFASANFMAHAEGTKVAVVDRNLITRDSSAAKWMRSVIDSKYQQYQAEIKNAQNALASARDDLKRQSPNLDAGSIRKRRAAIRQQANELSRVLQARKSELDQMLNKGMAQIDDVLNETRHKDDHERNKKSEDRFIYRQKSDTDRGSVKKIEPKFA